ncbi:MAG: YkgJ family cysteine cluster protein [Dehalococcoidales bacterium]|nr:YkgJ family cysteine cluster protein [Dehalococcoidales bacterium]
MGIKVNAPGIVYDSDCKEQQFFSPCFCCGICCSKYQVHLKLAEAQDIAEHLGISLQEFRDNFTDPNWPGTETCLLRHKDGACIFLEHEPESAARLCRIHTFKPLACRQWSANPYRKECRQGLQQYWGLSVDVDGKIAGPIESLKRFQLFLETLE